MNENKLYMKWWFWIIIAIVVISTTWFIVGTFSVQNDCTEYEELLNDWVEWYDDYEIAMEDYCELNPTNNLCDVWFE